MENRKSTANYPPLFASSRYYSKKEFQFPITASNKTITNTTVLKHNTGITLMYFRSGQGKIVVNTREYPVHKGVLMCLGTYHYFQLKPGPSPLELTQCRLSYDTFLYMAANPYYSFTELRLAINPLTSILEGHMIERTEAALDELVAATIRHKKKGGEIEFLLCMKVMGIMQKTFNRDMWIDD